MTTPYVWWEGQWNVWVPGDTTYRATLAWWWCLGHNLAVVGYFDCAWLCGRYGLQVWDPQPEWAP